MTTDETRMKLWSIGGGKGGVGKSLITLGLGVALSRLGKRVILIDGDLGGANLHTLVGVRYPHITLEHFLTNKVSRLEDTIIETPLEGIGLICGADDLLGVANPSYTQKIKLLDQLEQLPAQYVLMDLGAGTSFNTLDFFNYCSGKIALFTSQATSLQNAYGFIKSALYRKVSREFAGDDEFFHLLYGEGEARGGKSIPLIKDILNYFEDTNPEKWVLLTRLLRNFHLFLVLNMVQSKGDLKNADIIVSLCQNYLIIQPEIMGYVPFDAGVEPAMDQTIPFFLYQRKSKAMAVLDQIALRLVEETKIL